MPAAEVPHRGGSRAPYLCDFPSACPTSLARGWEGYSPLSVSSSMILGNVLHTLHAIAFCHYFLSMSLSLQSISWSANKPLCNRSRFFSFPQFATCFHSCWKHSSPDLHVMCNRRGRKELSLLPFSTTPLLPP